MLYFLGSSAEYVMAAIEKPNQREHDAAAFGKHLAMARKELKAMARSGEGDSECYNRAGGHGM